MNRAFILAPLLAALAGCSCTTNTSTQTHPARHATASPHRTEVPVQVAPDANIRPCARFARPAGTPLKGGMEFEDGGVHVVLWPGEECRAADSGLLMGVDK